MPATQLGLYELLGPFLPLGFTFPAHIDKYLSILSIEQLRESIDEDIVVFSGTASFGGEGGASPILEHHEPGKAKFIWNEFTIQFRLTIPRDGAQFISDVAAELTALPAGADRAQLEALFNLWGPVEQDLVAPTPTDYPGTQFKLELMLNSVAISLGDNWNPGKINADGRIVPDDGDEVFLLLPKVIFTFERTDDAELQPTFSLNSWGSANFDGPADLAIGEFITMEPAIALNKSGNFAFGIEHAVVDLSPDATPPEILQLFGADEAFRGVYIKSARIYATSGSTGSGVHFAAQDMLYSFDGKLSMEGQIEFLGPEFILDADVRLLQGKAIIEYKKGESNKTGNVISYAGGSATLNQRGIIHVIATGGVPPYSIQVHLTVDGTTTDLWDNTLRTAKISTNMDATVPILRDADTGKLVVTVTDAAPNENKRTWRMTLDPFSIAAVEAEDIIPDGLPGDQAPHIPAATSSITNGTLEPGYLVSHSPSASDTIERISLSGPGEISAQSDGDAIIVNAQGGISVDVQPGDTKNVEITFAATNERNETSQLFFDVDKPPAKYLNTLRPYYVENNINCHDERFLSSTAPSGISNESGADAIRKWLEQDPAAGMPTVKITARASSDGGSAYNKRLSERRLDIARAVIESVATISSDEATGEVGAQPNDDFREAEIVATFPARVQKQITIRINRAALPPAVIPVEPEATPKAPPPAKNEAPPAIRRLGFRFRLEHNSLVMFEFYGRIDFETDLEEAFRNPGDDNLKIRQLPGAAEDVATNPQDGVIDFKINVTYDPTTSFATETLTMGADPADKDGLLHLDNPNNNAAINTLGSTLIFMPVINAATTVLDSDREGSWVPLAIAGLGSAFVGFTGTFQTKKIILYGGELTVRQYAPSFSDINFIDLALLFDYGIDFEIHVNSLNIHSTKQARVRYRALGFNLNFTGEPTYQPIFDTSRGYELDLSDPGLINLPDPLGDIIKILGARIARFNPLVLEIDLGLKINLGVITVDRMKVKVPLDPPGPPLITGAGASLNVESVLIGSGYVELRDNGFLGQLDITLISLKLRIAASLAVLFERNEATGRDYLGIFAGMVVEFPSPIPLGQSGVGIFGFSGLFAMHFKRLEDPRQPGDSVSPALRWLEKSGGDPTKIFGPPPNRDQLWGPEMDRWSFGLGTILGTMEGGVLINFRGMLVLELPGPRVLIFSKVQLITLLPSLDDTELTVGLLGVIDLDFNQMQLTVGILVDFKIESLVKIRIPIEIFFNLDDPTDWHLSIGTLQAPVTADVLGIVKGRGYFMINSKALDIPTGENGELTNFPGIAVALGLDAALVLGDTNIGLYLRVAAGAHLGVSFSPFFIAGRIYLEGELRLFIVSITARGDFIIEAPDPTYIQGEIYGKVDFYFFSVEGCVEFSVGSKDRTLTPPKLARGLFLQSYAPVLEAGQGTIRPIDASLGNAFEIGGSNDDEIPVVPIDSIPVIQFHGSPLVLFNSNSHTTTFTEELPLSPVQQNQGWINAGGGRALRYTLKEINLSPPLPTSSDKPPTAWRYERITDGDGSDTQIDLALMSRIPTAASRALERSSDLDDRVDGQWGGVCDPVAPPACVLWTFCGQQLGPSGSGWQLDGIPMPDHEGTIRRTDPPTALFIEEPENTSADKLLLPFLGQLTGIVERPAIVIGVNAKNRKSSNETNNFSTMVKKNTLSERGRARDIKPIEQPAMQLPVFSLQNKSTAVNAAAAAIDLKDPGCFRGLQLPNSTAIRNRNNDDLKPTKEFKDWFEKRGLHNWIIIHTRPAVVVRLLLTVESKLFKKIGDLRIIQLDKNGEALSNVSLLDHPFVSITDYAAQLPSEWIDSDKPWLEKIVPAVQLIEQTPYKHLSPILLTIKPDEKCDRIKLQNDSDPKSEKPSQVILAAAEVCSIAEQEREDDETNQQNGVIGELVDYLQNPEGDILFDKGELYTIELVYDVESKSAGGDIDELTNEKQQFQFRTDDKPPEKLEPWVLGTTPQNDAGYHFYEDPVEVLFNDDSILQLYEKYDKELQLCLRASDGVHEAEEDEIIDALELVVALFASPYREALTALVATKSLPCIGEPQAQPHGSFTSALTLRPRKTYTLDVKGIPETTSFTGNEPLRPLFRQSFTTSRFATLGALIETLSAQRIRHRALKRSLILPLGTNTLIKPDIEIQNLLVAAGEQALPAAAETGITVYWIFDSTQNSYRVHFVMIDAAEPLWRIRQEPALVSVAAQDDPAFKRLVRTATPHLELIESPESGDPTLVTRFVRSVSGTRTLAMLDSTAVIPDTGIPLHLVARRTTSQLFLTLNTEIRESLPVVNIKPAAPWEEDDDE